MIDEQYNYSDQKSTKYTFNAEAVIASISKATAANGYDLGIPVIDGKFHRFSIGEKKNAAGYYKFFSDGVPAGIYGDWISGQKYKWCAIAESDLSQLERTVINERFQALKAERETLQAEVHKEAAIEASRIWNEASEAVPADHGYPAKKRIQPIGIRLDGKDRLVVPIYGIDGIKSLQFIASNGFKKYLTGGKKSGGFLKLPGNDATILIAEGYATAVSLHMATGYSVFAAFDANNLKSVAAYVRGIHKSSTIIICCDNDQWKPESGNPGLDKGREAADSIKALPAVPIFKDVSTKPTDFNDLMILEGIEAVKVQIDGVTERQKEKPAVFYITGAELLRREFKDPLFLVPGFLPIGLSLLCGKPKSGKSLLADGLAIAVATGGRFFDVPVEKQPVLLLGLEDTHRRLQDRFRKMTALSDSPDLSGLFVCKEFRKADAGGIDLLEEMIQTHKPGLIIIDTLKKFKASSNGKQSLYDEAYESLEAVKALADKYRISVLIVHHSRKMESDDPFDSVSGSLGLNAVPDNILIMQKKQAGMILYTTGRDIEPTEKAIKLHPESLTWHCEGDASEVQSSRQQQAIYDCLKTSACPLKPKSIHSLIPGISYDVVRQLLKKMLNANKIILNPDGMYTVHNNNNNDFFSKTATEKKEENHSQCSQRSQRSQRSQNDVVDIFVNTVNGEDIRCSQKIINNNSDLDSFVNGVNGVNTPLEKDIHSAFDLKFNPETGRNEVII